MKWWVYRDNRISEKAYLKDELKNLPSLSRDTLVCSVNTGDWQTISEVSDLHELVDSNGNGKHSPNESVVQSRRYPHFANTSSGDETDAPELLDVQGNVLQWTGDPGVLRALHLKTFLLSVLTLGLYYLWGKHESTKYILENLRMSGESISYNGNPLERCLGSVLTGVCGILAGSGAYWLLTGPVTRFWVQGLFVTGLVVTVLGLYNTVWYRTRGYLLENLSLGHFDFTQTGSCVSYGVRAVLRQCLVLGSMGLYYPLYRHWRLGTLTERSVFNGEAFEYTGQPRRLVTCFLSSLFRRTVLPLVGLLALAGLFQTFFIAEPNSVITLDEVRLYRSVFLPVFSIAVMGCLVATLTKYHQEEYAYLLRNVYWNEARFNFQGDPRDFTRLCVFSEGLSWLTLGLSNAYFTHRKLTYFTSELEVDAPFQIEASPSGEGDAGSSAEGLLIPSVQLLGLVRF